MDELANNSINRTARTSKISGLIISCLYELEPKYLLLISVAVSTVLTLPIVAGMSFYFHHEVTRDYLITGGVASIIVSCSVMLVITSLLAEYKRIEEALRIAAITFESQDMIIVTDANGIILNVNQTFTEQTGYSAEEVLGKTPALLNPDHQNNFYQRMREISANEAAKWQGEVQVIRKDGTKYFGCLTISAIHGKNVGVTNYVGIYSDITQRKESEAEIHRLAFYDQLTGLSNRHLLTDRLQQALATTERHSNYGAVIFIDLDNFKSINDTTGYSAGDQLLIQVAQRLQSCVRAEDSVARVDGDEFAVVIDDLSSDKHQASIQAKIVCEQILKGIDKPYIVNGQTHHTTCSIGIALFRNHEATVDELFKHADIALHQARALGHNAIYFFDPAIQTEIEHRYALISDLHHALPNHQLELYYQLQIDSNNHVLGAEALLRWNHPERGLVSPAEFIPLAEETGFILQIGQWVLETACTNLKIWEDDPITYDLQLAVNVSARQFRQSDFVEQVQIVLNKTGINPARLKLELTESSMLDNIDKTIGKMQALKSIGIGLSMDDFGTGYSSLTYLKRLPLDQIKIDQSFVHDITTDSNDAVIVRTIIGMAKNLSLNILAEGVETKQQVEFLMQHGCHAFQGFMFSKPVPLPDFELLLKKYYAE